MEDRLPRFILPWGTFVVRPESLGRYEILVDTVQHSVKRRYSVRIEFERGECQVTLRTGEAILCATCGRAMLDPGRGTMGHVLCRPCREDDPASTLRRGASRISLRDGS